MTPDSEIACRMLTPEAFLALRPDLASFPKTLHAFTYGENTRMFCAFAGDTMVGVVKLNVLDTNTHIEFIETSATHRHRGVAKGMLQQLFEHSQAHGVTLTNQSYTDDGKSYLLRELERLKSAFPGRFFDIPNM